MYGILVGRSEGKRLIGRPRRRWEGCIEMALREVGWDNGLDLMWLRIATGGELL